MNLTDNKNNDSPGVPVIRIVDDDAMMLSSWVFLLEGEHRTVRAYTGECQVIFRRFCS